MRVWLTTGTFFLTGSVTLHTTNPKNKSWNKSMCAYQDANAYTVLTKEMRRLLRGTGLRLPKHGSKDIVEVELTASKPRMD